MELDRLVQYISEIQSIAQQGLYYGHDKFDKERYERLREISILMMAEKTDLPLNTVKGVFASGYGYETPKVDTRAAIFKGDKILLVKENSGKWSIPGGWCEYHMSPMENTIKEAKEESGRDVVIKSVISVQDRSKHNSPEYAYGVIKIFYLCEEVGGEFTENIETTDVGYFTLDSIPALAEEKCNMEQIKMCFEAHLNPNFKTHFD